MNDPRVRSEYSIAEIIMAGIIMFQFKLESRLEINSRRKSKTFKKNYKSIFGLKLPHMDTVDRVFRLLDPDEIEGIKTALMHDIIFKRRLNKFKLFGKYFIIAIDGTGLHSFSKPPDGGYIYKTSKKGKITYYRQVLEAKLLCFNGFSLSIGTEWIANTQTEYDKQDCELKACYRLIKKIKVNFPKLPVLIVADGLYPNQNIFKLCRENGWEWLIAHKNGNLKSVWKEVNCLTALSDDNSLNEKESLKSRTTLRNYHWINDIDYEGYTLHWGQCLESIIFPSAKMIEDKIKITRFVYISSLKLSQDNIVSIIKAGRLRYKIENEGFNTQKNLGYNLKHKFSRTNFKASQNYYQCLQIAHILNQLVELRDKFRELLTDYKTTITYLWNMTIWYLVFNTIEKEFFSDIDDRKRQIRFVT